MPQSQGLLDKIFMIVEDEYLTATMLTMALEGAGAKVIGPVSNAKTAFELLERQPSAIDAAILDVNLNGAMDFSIADYLVSLGIQLFLRPNMIETFCQKDLGVSSIRETNRIKQDCSRFVWQ